MHIEMNAYNTGTSTESFKSNAHDFRQTKYTISWTREITGVLLVSSRLVELVRAVLCFCGPLFSCCSAVYLHLCPRWAGCRSNNPVSSFQRPRAGWPCHSRRCDGALLACSTPIPILIEDFEENSRSSWLVTHATRWRLLCVWNAWWWYRKIWM